MAEDQLQARRQTLHASGCRQHPVPGVHRRAMLRRCLQVSAGGLVSALMGVSNFKTCWIGWPGQLQQATDGSLSGVKQLPLSVPVTTWAHYLVLGPHLPLEGSQQLWLCARVLSRMVMLPSLPRRCCLCRRLCGPRAVQGRPDGCPCCRGILSSLPGSQDGDLHPLVYLAAVHLRGMECLANLSAGFTLLCALRCFSLAKLLFALRMGSLLRALLQPCSVLVQVDLHYNGFCNSVLWQLFHYVPLNMDSKLSETRTLQFQWAAHQEANRRFAQVGRLLVPLPTRVQVDLLEPPVVCLLHAGRHGSFQVCEWRQAEASS